MGPSQICGCPFREPRVFTIAHFFWAGTCAVDNACARRKQRLGNKHHETHISPWPGLCIFLNFGAILAWNMIGPGIWHIAKIECAVAGTEALLSGSLPVRFTFIHFSTPARRKRSHSAALPEVMMSFLWAGGTCWRGWHDSQIMRVLPSLSAAFRGQVWDCVAVHIWNWGHKGGWHSAMWSSVLSGNTLWSWTSWTRRVADTTSDSDGQ